MELQSGKYTIRCEANNYYIGRHTVEDKSLNPKRIFALEHHNQAPTWDFVKQHGPGNYYLLKTRDTPIADYKGLVFALLLGDNDIVKPSVWEIRKHPLFGMNCWTITLADNPRVGWAAPGSDEDNGNGQIAIKPIDAIGFPPQIPANMLFIIEQAVDY